MYYSLITSIVTNILVILSQNSPMLYFARRAVKPSAVNRCSISLLATFDQTQDLPLAAQSLGTGDCCLQQILIEPHFADHDIADPLRQ